MALDVPVLIAEARVRATRLYPDSAPFQTAYVMGARAKTRMKLRTDCPFPSSSGWRQAYRLAWMGGYDSIRSHR